MLENPKALLQHLTNTKLYCMVKCDEQDKDVTMGDQQGSLSIKKRNKLLKTKKPSTTSRKAQLQVKRNGRIRNKKDDG